MELLERVGLPTELGRRYPAQLSGGQQQRVGVARALAADPPVMLMDEPFSAVDPVVRAQLQDEFLRLQAELGKTILFVTHDIDEAIKLGDQVAVLRVGGKLAQLATPAELLAAPADDFVADFVGRDRGYRALGFRAGRDLPLAKEPTVQLGAEQAAGRPGGAATAGCSWSTTTTARWAGSTCGSSRPGATVEPRTAAPRRHGGHGRATRCAPPSTPRCPRRPAAASSSTTTAGCSAPSPPARCSTGSRPSAARAHADDRSRRNPSPRPGAANDRPTCRTTSSRPSTGPAPTPGSRCCRWSSGWSSRCRWAGWRSRYRRVYPPLIIWPACSTRSRRWRCSS